MIRKHILTVIYTAASKNKMAPLYNMLRLIRDENMLIVLIKYYVNITF